jgi:hypothetical protein
MFRRLSLLAALVTIVACRDSGPTVIRPTLQPAPEQPGVAIETAGIIEINGTDLEPAFLISGSHRYTLEGPETGQLWRVAGAEVRVRGVQSGGLGIWVESYRVLRINGRDVIDGVVIAMDGGFALRSDDGSMFPLTDEAMDLSQHLGRRVWFAVRTEEAPAAFGVIAE